MTCKSRKKSTATATLSVYCTVKYTVDLLNELVHKPRDLGNHYYDIIDNKKVDLIERVAV